MKLSDEEVIKLAIANDFQEGLLQTWDGQKPAGFYTSNNQSILAFAKALEAKLLDVDMEPVAYYDAREEDETEAFMFPSLYKAHIERNSSVKHYQPLYTAAQLAAHAEKARVYALMVAAELCEEDITDYDEAQDFAEALRAMARGE